METIFVTRGFIGSHLVGEAFRRDLRGRILDNLDTGKIAYLAG